jgi:hypothetical protein
MSRWSTFVDRRNGRTIKSGISPEPMRSSTGADGIYRGVVLKTYATDDSSRSEAHPFAVKCDVLLYRALYTLLQVPVLQSNHGLNDADLWIPRPSSRSLGGGPLNLAGRSLRGALEPFPTKLGDLDGDHVLVQFIEHDPEFPVIMGAYPHPRTKRLVVAGPGWQEAALGIERGKPQLGERYFRYRGVEVRINDSGDVLVDTVGAYNKLGEVTETPTPLGGQVRLRVKGTERFTVEVDGADVLEVYKLGLIPQVDLIEGALQPFVRGLDLQTALSTLSVALNAYATAIATPPGAPPNAAVTVAVAGAAAAALATQVTAFAAEVTAALSLKIRGD